LASNKRNAYHRARIELRLAGMLIDAADGKVDWNVQSH
jgi:hypothetical protein